MILTRLARKWWVAPVLLPVLCIDALWMVRNEGRSCQVAEFFRSFSGEQTGGCGGVPRVAIWANGDARAIGGNGYLTTKPARTDPALGIVAVRWGTEVRGFLAPCTREEWVHISNNTDVWFSGVPIGPAVVDALADAGYPLPLALRNGLANDGGSATTFIWWGAAHDVVAVFAWIVAMSAVWFRLGAVEQWIRGLDIHPLVCRSCRYDLRGLSQGAPCPECGRRRSRAA